LDVLLTQQLGVPLIQHGDAHFLPASFLLLTLTFLWCSPSVRQSIHWFALNSTHTFLRLLHQFKFLCLCSKRWYVLRACSSKLYVSRCFLLLEGSWSLVTSSPLSTTKENFLCVSGAFSWPVVLTAMYANSSFFVVMTSTIWTTSKVLMLGGCFTLERHQPLDKQPWQCLLQLSSLHNLCTNREVSVAE